MEGVRLGIFASKMATIFYDQIITDSDEMKKVYRKTFGIKSTVIAYGSTMIVNKKSKLIKNSLKKTILFNSWQVNP